MNNDSLDLYILNQCAISRNKPLVDIEENIKLLEQHVRLHPEDAKLYNAEIQLQEEILDRLIKERKEKTRFTWIIFTLAAVLISCFLSQFLI